MFVDDRKHFADAYAGAMSGREKKAIAAQDTARCHETTAREIYYADDTIKKSYRLRRAMPPSASAMIR